MRHIFGPVASRRLGLSLGVDLVPHKTCTFDCIYCECGPTTRLTAQPTRLVAADAVLEELKEVLAQQQQRLDYITFSGSGEPTLNQELGRVVAGIKAMTDIPLALLTNGSLLHRTEVREAVNRIDLIMPSLDTVTETVFQRLNRPDPDISLEEMLKGLRALRSAAKGEIWLEILFVAGINDTSQEIEGLKREVDRIAPDRVQINSVDRPPAEDEAGPVDFNRLTELANLFGPRAEVIFNPPQDFRPGRQKELAEAVLGLISRRPCTTADLKVALGRSDAEIGSLLKMLTLKGQVQEEVLGDRVFLRALASKE